MPLHGCSLGSCVPPHLLVIVLVLGLVAPVGAQRAVISVGHPGVAPVVTDKTVSLSWTLPEESTATTGYRLEAGTGPGLTNIVTADAGMAPAFAASGVPPGRYYVRIRALNGNGVSAPSNEVVVDVP